ncbi:protein SUPPRESSOR OF MAX2 1-like isoform X2 [Gastrolobium bilobum]|uniref:protein SUPPRESSOR OF MAX2 1-like isoform X2 n=1 Tax=Gastrolobium bilobum TaxID=150636 RepID=UPI002AB25008|nr:protein SUPPRESSOR OF MAX2 1-like isoform X2 [Gastrolobium bilobum]
MRAGLSTIQQTLTPEAASVLNHSIAEAGRRNHGQTTPLHVAATLLASPSGFLRQACIKSHPNSSHPLQCRALELCFSVALERLPTSQNTSPSMEPPISNALMAALKRAQAHQRRGYPEQQQQPLLAVKVELEHLIISILDDPSVSRVMREASFSSPAVKATIEQSLNSVPSTVNSNSIGLGFRPGAVAGATAPGRNLYLNPRLQQGSGGQLGQQKGEEVKRVVDILLRTKKRNPILVCDSEPEAAIKEVLKKIENKELGDGAFSNAHVIHLEKELPSDRAQIPTRLKELGDLIETRLGNSGCGGVFINLGDLKWLVEQPVGFGVGGLGNMQQLTLAEVGRAAVAEMGRLVAKFGECGVGRLWLLGTATCETYLRCQVYHPSMENDWDLQPVPITTRTPLPAMFPRLGTNGILGTSLESLSPLKTLPTTTITPLRRASENIDPAGVSTCCPQCMQNYEQEVADMLKETEKSDTEFKSEAARPPLPQWLQSARTNNDNAKVMDQSNSQEVNMKRRTQEIQKKWYDACLNLHPKFHQQNGSRERIAPTPFSMAGLYSVSMLGHQFQPKIPMNKNLGTSLQLSSNPMPIQPPERESPVTTELVLGQTKPTDTVPEETHRERMTDFLGCLSSESLDKFDELKSKKLLDADSFKKLLKGLTEKVWWQQDAASAVATTVTQCKLGNGKRRAKGNTWLLFVGPDRVGKKKMAATLSELVSGSNPIIIPVAQRRCGDGDSDIHHLRGKTALDRIAEAIRRNPLSVIVLEDIDEANALVRGNLKRAMDQGRFLDSHGREISLGNVMFILTANWLPEDLRYLSNGTPLDEDKLANLATGGWQLRLSVSKRAITKRRPSWLSDEDRSLKQRKEEINNSGLGLSFDLNEAAATDADADAEDDRADGSLNSSDFTVDHEDNNHILRDRIPRDLLDSVDDAIVFKPLNFDLLRRNFASSIAKRFSTVVGNGISIEVQEEALDKITSGVWLGQTTIDEWMDKALVPTFHHLNKNFNSSTHDHESLILVRLEDDGHSDRRSSQEWLPATVRVVADEY